MKKKIITIVILIALIISGVIYLKINDFNNDEIMKDVTNESDEIEEIIKIKPKYKEVDYTAFNKAMDEVAKNHKCVGMSIAMFQDGEIVYTYNIGYENKEKGILASDDTKYRLASTSKMISTLGLMRLYDEGLFDITDSIEDVTGLKFNSEHGVISFIDLLTHTSGLYDSGAFNEACNGKRYDTSYVLERSHKNYPVGSKYLYTNFGMGVIGSIVEVLKDEYFHTYMRKYFNDLGIDAAYCVDELTDKSNVSKIYDNNGTIDVKNWGKTTKYFDSYGLGNSYMMTLGELICSAPSLAKLGIIMAGDGTYDDKQFISNDALEKMNTSYFTYIDEDNRYHYDVGLGTNIYNVLVDNRSLHGHTGYAYQASSALLFDRTDKTGFALCSNHADRAKNENGIDRYIDDVADTVYKYFFQLEENND